MRVKFYCGPYLRVWMPEVEEKVQIRECCEESKYEKHNWGWKHCPDCGKEIGDCKEVVKVRQTLGDYFNKVWGNNVPFWENTIEERSYCLIYGRGCISFEPFEFEELELPILSIEVFDKDADWMKLIDHLVKNGIKYSRHIGIFQFAT